MVSPAPRLYRRIYIFASDTDVEVISRIGRVWDEDDQLDPAALDLAENIIKVRWLGWSDGRLIVWSVD